jgi:hypothetical protein
MGWADDSDVTVLAEYGAVIAAPEMRREIVERLLADPRAFGGAWRQGWNLDHPGLPGQLEPVLMALADPAAPQPVRDRSYLALTLARQAAPADVTAPVLAIAARTDLDHGLRALAARTASALDEAAAVPVLAAMLEEISAHPDRDPDDEIRGIALSVLWPRHLTAEALAASLPRPRRDNLIGAYYIFRERLPGLLSDGDVPYVLQSALPAASALSDDADLTDRLLDRAFACQDVAPVIGLAADLAAERLRAELELPVPSPLDDRDAEGAETDRSRELRRLLVTELLSRAPNPGELTRWLLWGWKPSRAARDRIAEAVRRGQDTTPLYRRGLLVPDDLQWALAQAASAGPEAADTWVSLLRAIFDPRRPEAPEAAWQARRTTLWPAFSSWFDPVDLGSPAEEHQRMIFETTRPRSAGWDGAQEHVARVLDLYERAATEADAFPLLVYLLQYDPGTGRGVIAQSDDLAARPGISLLPPGAWAGRIRDASLNYLQVGAAPGPEILDAPDRLTLQAQAGYLALAFLAQETTPGSPHSPGDPVLARWASAILIARSAGPRSDDARTRGACSSPASPRPRRRSCRASSTG